MRKQEWVHETAKQLYNEWLASDQGAYELFKSGVEAGINHPEFEPEKPVYTYVVEHSSTRRKFYYTVFKDGAYLDHSCSIFTTKKQAGKSAKAIIAILEKGD